MFARGRGRSGRLDDREGSAKGEDRGRGKRVSKRFSVERKIDEKVADLSLDAISVRDHVQLQKRSRGKKNEALATSTCLASGHEKGRD